MLLVSSKSIVLRTYKLLSLIFLVSILSFSCDNDNSSSNVEEEEETVEEEIINANESSTFMVTEEIDAVIERDRLGRTMPITDFTATGIYLEPGKSITVDVSVTKGSDLPTILIGTYSRYVDHWNPISVQLKQGKNTLTNSSTKESFIYIRYSGNNADSEATVTIKGGLKAPFFKLGETSNSSFKTLLDDYETTDVQLCSDKAIIVARRNIALKYKNQDWEELLETVDRMIEIEDHINGLDSSSNIHTPSKNRYLLTETDNSDYWMAATWFRTFYFQNDAIDFVLDINKLKNDGWGPWHEIGHQHQLNNLTWSHVVEVTVNIYSLAVEREFGNVSRLKRDNVWEAINNYLSLPDGDKDYNGNIGLFVRLGLYQQLWLQYGDSFFINLHKKVREEAKTLDTAEKKMAYFMLKASEVSGHNLNDFFKKWGFKLSTQDFDAVDALGLPEPPVDLSTLQD